MEGEHSLGTPLATCALCRQAYSLLTYYVRLTSLAIIEFIAPERVLGTCVRPRVAEPDCEPVTCERVHLPPHPLYRDSFKWRGERGAGP